jgi:hypothetical protein
MSDERNAALSDLQRWYASNCDGDWEEEFGVCIETVANPGWRVSIDLIGTNLQGVAYPPFERASADDAWISCCVENEVFIGLGDPTSLEEIAAQFVNWAKASRKNWLQPPPTPSTEEQQRCQDEEFWTSLGEELGPEICTNAGCTRRRIALSVKCRAHHFEMITRRPAP